MSSQWIWGKCNTFLSQKSIQESFRNLSKKALVSLFLSLKLFADDQSSGELICLLVWSRNIKLREKRWSALNFASMQISNVKHCTVLEVVFPDAVHGTVKVMEQASTIFWWAFSFNVTFLPKLASSLGGSHSKSLKVDKLTRSLSLSGLPFPFDEG